MINFHNNTDFYGNVRQVIQGNEGFSAHVYADSSNIPTIGYGYAMVIKKNGEFMLDGAILWSDFAIIGITKTTDMENKLNAIITDLNNTTLSSDAKKAAIAAKVAELDALVPDLTEPQSQTLYNQVFNRKINDLHTQFKTVLGTTNGDALWAAMQGSSELIALADMVYNGGAGLVGKNLINAIWDGNRAEAWYEIRYNSNRLAWAQINGTASANDLAAIQRGEDKGLAKRRFYEAELFGLYNTGDTTSDLAEATQTYKMFTTHRVEILQYEAAYGNVNSQPGSRGDWIAKANSDYNLSGSAQVHTLRDELKPAADVLIQKYVKPEYGVDGTLINQLNIQVASDNAFILTGEDTADRTGSDADLLIGRDGGSDLLSGGGGNDLLIGQAGSDILAGGKGDDTLMGGKGFDTYIWSPGDGNDRIIEEKEDNGKVSGIIKINNGPGHEFNAAGGFIKDGDNDIWKKTMDDGSIITLTHNSPWKMVTQDGSELLLGEDFESGDFGIKLYEAPQSDRTLTGDDDNDLVFSAGYVIGDGGGSISYFGFSGAISGTGVSDYFLHGWKMFGYTSADLLPPSLHIDGNGGNDHLAGLAGEDEINGGTGNDLIVGDVFMRAMEPGPYPEEPSWAQTGTGDILRGDAGRDVIYGVYGDDLILGGEDGDFLSGGQDDDVLEGDAGDDLLAGGDGGDQLLGGSGNDVLYGDAEIDNVDFLSSIDVASWQAGIGYDEQGRISSVTFQGFNVYQSSAPGDDLLSGGAGNDALGGGSGNDSLLGEDGHDRLEGGAGDDFLSGGTDNDLMSGDGGDDILYGGSGIDELQGGEGADLMYGDSGDDILLGGAGNDVLDGGTGNDYFDGGDGADIYSFGLGSGCDTIYDSGTTGGDVVRFNSEVKPADVTLFEYQDHLVLSLDNMNDTLVLSNWFTPGAGKIGQLEFACGTVWDITTITGLLQTAGNSQPGGADGNAPPLELNDTGTGITVGGTYFRLPLGYGFIANGELTEWDIRRLLAFASYRQGRDAAGDPSSANKTIQGSAYDDYLYGGSGNDTLYGYEGADYLSGGSGHDHLYGGSEQDRLGGGEGDDNLQGDSGDDFLDGGPGNDSLTDTDGNNTLLGGDGDDWLLTGGGDNITDGGNGNDSLMVIYGGHNVLEGGAGDDTLTGGSGTDTLDGGAGNDTIYAGSGNNTLSGKQGDDVLYGGTGDDIYLFGRGDGHDTINGAFRASDHPGILHFAPDVAGGDIIASRGSYAQGSGYDLILTIKDTGDRVTLKDWYSHSWWGSNSNIRDTGIQFGDGTFMDMNLVKQIPLVGTDENDVIYSGGFADVLDGGAGDDQLQGDIYDDIYLFGRGAGQDTIYEFGGAENGNTIRFKAGIAPEDVTIWEESGHLCLGINGSDDKITVEGAWHRLVMGNRMGCQIGRVEFDDGTVWDESVLYGQSFQLQGTTDWDYMEGTVNNDFFYGLDGNDTIITGPGDDLLDGGVDPDTLTGGAGRDVYMFNLGDGADRIIDAAENGTGNIIAFGDGISRETVSLVLDGNILTVHYGTVGDQIRIANFDPSGVKGSLVIDTFAFADGSQASLFHLTNTAPVVDVMPQDQAATEESTYSFTIPPDTFSDVDTGDSLIYTAALGNGNALPGWLAFDPLTCTFSGTPGNGDAGILDVTVIATDTAGATAVAGFVLDIANHIVGTGAGNNLVGTALRDVIEGFAGNDTLQGGEGNDIIIGGAGLDNLQGGAGDDLFLIEGTDTAFDTFNGGEGFDKVLGGAGNDVIRLHNFSGANTVEMIDGGAGFNTIAGNDSGNLIDLSGAALVNIAQIESGLGNDTVIGSVGNDIIIGGAGLDNLQGGAGDDLYLFNMGDGTDIINDNDATGFDVVSFLAGIGNNNVGLFKNGNSLDIGYGSTDKISIKNFFSGANYQTDQVKLEGGSYITAADINRIIQDIAAYAVSEGITLSSVNDVRNNEHLMTMIAGSWHA